MQLQVGPFTIVGHQRGPATATARVSAAGHALAAIWSWIADWPALGGPQTGRPSFDLPRHALGTAEGVEHGSFVAMEFDSSGFLGAHVDGATDLALDVTELLERFGRGQDWAVDAEFTANNTRAALVQFAPLEGQGPALLCHAQGQAVRLPEALRDWIRSRRLFGWGVSRDIPCIAALTGLELDIEDGADALALRMPGARRGLSLATATALLEGSTLPKDQQRADWAAAALTTAAWRYAAADACATAACWRHLRAAEPLSPLAVPPPPSEVWLEAARRATPPPAPRPPNGGMLDADALAAAARAAEAARPPPLDHYSGLDDTGQVEITSLGAQGDLFEAEVDAVAPPPKASRPWFTHGGDEPRKLRRDAFAQGAARAGRALDSLVAEAVGEGIVFHMHTEPTPSERRNHPSLFDKERWGAQPEELFAHYRHNRLSAPCPPGVELFDFLRLVTPIGVVPKPSSPGEIRPIFDARRSGCNACLIHVPIALATPERVLRLLRPGMWSCSEDARHWYHQILVHPDSRKYQGYYDPFANEYRVFRVAAFGGSTIPAYAQAVSVEAARQALEHLGRTTNVTADFRALDGRWEDSAPDAEHWVFIVVYLDDYAVFGSTRAACEAGHRALMETLERLGIETKAAKGTRITQQLRWIGMDYNTTHAPAMSLPRDKADAYMEDILAAYRAPTCDAARLDRLVGRLLWAARAWAWGGAFLKHLHSAMLTARAGSVALTDEARAELSVWYAWLPRASRGIRQQPNNAGPRRITLSPQMELHDALEQVRREVDRSPADSALLVRADSTAVRRTLRGAWPAPWEAHRRLVAVALAAMRRGITVGTERATPATPAPTARTFNLTPHFRAQVHQLWAQIGLAGEPWDVFADDSIGDPIRWLETPPDNGSPQPSGALLYPPFALLEATFAVANKWLGVSTRHTALAIVPWRNKASWFYRNVAPTGRWVVVDVWFPNQRKELRPSISFFERAGDGRPAPPAQFPTLVLASRASPAVDQTQAAHARLAAWAAANRQAAARLRGMHH